MQCAANVTWPMQTQSVLLFSSNPAVLKKHERGAGGFLHWQKFLYVMMMAML